MSQLQKKIVQCLDLLREATKGMTPTLTQSLIKKYGRDPFIILISCLLSLRARDTMTLPVSLILFERARTPEELLKIPLNELEELLYPLGFYHKKAQVIRSASLELLTRFKGKVPHTEEELLSIKGVGHKTANLILGSAFEIPAICVDTHVHRLANRLGWVQTTHPDDTERELKRLVPQEYWIELNTCLVLWGQNVCVPLSPKCSQCVLNPLCPKVGVTRSR